MHKNQFLLASCVLLGLSAPTEGHALSHRPGELFSAPEWREMSGDLRLDNDVAILADGRRIVGQILSIPALQYSFGSVNFDPSEIALISVGNLDGQRKMQLITRSGQQFVAAVPQAPLRFWVKQGDAAGERQFDIASFNFIALRPRYNNVAPPINKLYHLTLQNGDQLSVVLDRQELHLSDGWKERTINSDQLVEVSFNGGLQGTIDAAGEDCELGFAFVREPSLSLRIPGSDHSLSVAWDKIGLLSADLGNFAMLEQENSSWLEEPHWTHRVVRAPQPEVNEEPAPEIMLAESEEEQPAEPMMAEELVPVAAMMTVDNFEQQPVFEHAILVSEKPQEEPLDNMALVTGGQFYVSVAEDVPAARASNLLPTLDKPSLLVQLTDFYVDHSEVTNAEYQRFVRATGWTAPAHWTTGVPPEGLENEPVVNVSFADASAYAKWAGKRLPTELEWQRASDEASSLLAIQAVERKRSLGDDAFSILSFIAGLEPVIANEPELPVTVFTREREDMGGKVAEWTCSSAVCEPGSALALLPGLFRANLGQYQDHRIVRNGFAFDEEAPEYRTTLPQQEANMTTGFRCVRDL